MNAGPISATAAATRAAARQLLRIVIVGHVDHGKSTLVGRLFHDTGSLPDGKFEAIRKMCERRGMPFEWAFLMDAMQAERDQGITIDTAQIWFKTEKRDYTIIDAPGHKEFLKNMITGAAQSDAAVLVIDATEGVQEQSRRHGYLLHLLGVRQIAVAVNKMDAVGYREDVFTKIEAEYRDYLASIGVTPTFVVPVSAREGDNIATRSQAMEWYDGPTVVGALDSFQLPATSVDRPLRFPIQDVYKFDDRRILAGRIESGRLHVGDELMFSPSNNTARVKSIEVWPEPSDSDARPNTVGAGQCIGITLDDQLFVERGEMASHTTNPPVETEVFRAKLFWLGRKPLEKGKIYKMKIGTGEAQVTVQEIEHVLDTTDLSSSTTSKVERNQVGEVVLRSRRMLALDEHTRNGRTGRFVLIDGYDIAGGGIISMEGYADQRQLVTQRAKNITRVQHGVPTDERERQNGHKGGVLWFTGLSGAGKSTLATKLERALFDRGYQTYVLDGDNIRFGLNANLGFSPEERAENIRRVGEVAALFSRAGLLTITAFISPYQSDRERARKAAGEHFHEVYIKADLGTCEERDPKGLYAKARTGEIKDFTGISAPYEAPDTAELIIDTSNLSIDQALEELLGYVEKTFRS
ncbi:adenylyl-sulfate kinase [Microbaculum marinisediminis]|uniref:Adenylyl-sulfate kinase n=1 Tax=Microbaculum marinisediminis TaxID=2931392 RepID=A0AAW5QWX7_9HYPH|nr:adenylyl-sulfate kinase [Microbaculum sp. A6E488]MCT8972024.1 adenylyl-sulfate kinase [Microbaculum sp. A6E488]